MEAVRRLVCQGLRSLLPCEQSDLAVMRGQEDSNIHCTVVQDYLKMISAWTQADSLILWPQSTRPLFIHYTLHWLAPMMTAQNYFAGSPDLKSAKSL